MNKERSAGIGAIVFGLVYALMTAQLPASNMVGDPGPKVFPYLAAGIIILTGTLLVVRKPGEGSSKPYLTKAEWKKFAVLLAVYVAYAVLLGLCGFLIATPICLFVTSTLFSAGKKIAVWKRLLYSALVTLAIYALFAKALQVVLPAGTLIHFSF